MTNVYKMIFGIRIKLRKIKLTKENTVKKLFVFIQI